RKAVDQLRDFLEKSAAARFDRRPVQCRITIKTLEMVALQHRAIGRGDRHPPLGIELQGAIGHEQAHGALFPLAAARLLGLSDQWLARMPRSPMPLSCRGGPCALLRCDQPTLSRRENPPARTRGGA